MRDRRTIVGMVLLLSLGAASVTVAAGEPDLVLRSLRVKRLDACDNELRFKVKLTGPKTSLLAGSVTSPKWEAEWRYRIGLYSAEEADLLLHSIRVGNHPMSKKVGFSLPSAARLDCRNPEKPVYVTRVRVQVDDLDEQVELEENNIGTIDWKRQAGTGFNTCYVAAGANPCADRPTAHAVDVANPGD